MASTQIQESSNYLSDFQSFINETNVNSSNNAQCISGAGNELSVTTGRGCDFVLGPGSTFEINQISKANCTQIVNTNLDVTSQVKANITEKIQQYLEQRQSSKQGWLTLALNAQVQGASNETELVTRIKNSVNSVSSQVCDNTVNAYNAGTIDLCGIYGEDTNLIIDQNSVATAYQSCTMDVIIKAFQNDVVLQDVAQKVNQAQKSDQEGIGSLFKWLVVIAVILGVVIIVGIILYAVFGGFSSKPKEGEKKEGEKKEGGMSQEELMLLLSAQKSKGGESSLLPLLLAEQEGLGGAGGSESQSK
jgi:hypothetical protein